MSASAWSLGTIEQDRQRLQAIVAYWCQDVDVRQEATHLIDSLARQAAQRWEAQTEKGKA